MQHILYDAVINIVSKQLSSNNKNKLTATCF